MLSEWEQAYTNRKSTIFKALSNAAPSHLMDMNWFDFAGLGVGKTPATGKEWLIPNKASQDMDSAEQNVGVADDDNLEQPLVFKPREHKSPV